MELLILGIGGGRGYIVFFFFFFLSFSFFEISFSVEHLVESGDSGELPAWMYHLVAIHNSLLFVVVFHCVYK